MNLHINAGKRLSRPMYRRREQDPGDNGEVAVWAHKKLR